MEIESLEASVRARSSRIDALLRESEIAAARNRYPYYYPGYLPSRWGYYAPLPYPYYSYPYYDYMSSTARYLAARAAESADYLSEWRQREIASSYARLNALNPVAQMSDTLSQLNARVAHLENEISRLHSSGASSAATTTTTTTAAAAAATPATKTTAATPTTVTTKTTAASSSSSSATTAATTTATAASPAKPAVSGAATTSTSKAAAAAKTTAAPTAPTATPAVPTAESGKTNVV
eukprot:gnl/Spiro4/1665_TR872_c0_g1_i1.p1 gnl/Spiro4/1665_TR872_c0_g1~~gnl/Spiro4/1665_TR872_c0_g1_i1.p1  ORF type:complete len:249 (-),score=54.97 gnl/Spiro4/1665_TR872_c0_g1_i1:106-816(-)